ncbi:MAG TPA: Flp family type IVb pilin [Azospirillaceae bacterium]|nr:Flp family type IVb pilin [Azospirillaceae bacterium]
MLKLRSFAAKLIQDESGASMIEYTILISLISIALVATIGAVGNWASNEWSLLSSNVGAGG